MNRILTITTLSLLVLNSNLYAQEMQDNENCPEDELCDEVANATDKPELKNEIVKEEKRSKVLTVSQPGKTSTTPIQKLDNSEKSHLAAKEVHIEWNRNISPEDKKDYKWILGLGGHLRAGYTNIQNDISGNYGQHDGFELDAARLTVNGYFKDSAGFRFEIDGAVRRHGASNDPNALLSVQAKDAFIWWAPIKYAKITVGQFRPSFDGEANLTATERPFVSRSVMSKGVTGIDGPNVLKLSRSHEVGATLSTDGIFFDESEEGFGIKYAIGATNGSSSKRALNDNDALAYYGRLDFLYGKMVRVGGGATFNERTIGLAPNQLDETVFGWAADLAIDVSWASVAGGVIGESVSNTTQNEYSRLGFQGSLAVQEPFLGFQPKFRYAMLDDSNKLEGDALTYLTFGVNYVPDYPFRLLIDYTITGEQSPTEIDNNKLEILIEASW